MLSDNYYEHYKLPLLPAHSERVIPFGNKKTIESFKEGNCYPFAGENRSYVTLIVKQDKIVRGENYTYISTGCGICYFNATITAQYYDEGKNETFNKTMRSYIESFPVDVEVTATTSPTTH